MLLANGSPHTIVPSTVNAAVITLPVVIRDFSTLRVINFKYNFDPLESTMMYHCFYMGILPPPGSCLQYFLYRSINEPFTLHPLDSASTLSGSLIVVIIPNELHLAILDQLLENSFKTDPNVKWWWFSSFLPTAYGDEFQRIRRRQSSCTTAFAFNAGFAPVLYKAD